MTREHKKTRLVLHDWEVAHVEEAPVSGGHLALRDRLLDQFEWMPDNLVSIELEDAELGEIMRHMVYGGGNGGWQKRLMRSFMPALQRAMGAV
jgi:hypothetical protein